MINFKLAAFVHPITSLSEGFLYLTMTTETEIHHLRMSSADENRHVDVVLFESVEAMVDEAKNQSRYSSHLVMHSDDEASCLIVSDSSQKMLEAALRESEPELFAYHQKELQHA